MKAIEVKDLSFKYDVKDVLKGISFSIEKGSYVGILGPNGSGKSTLAKLLIGLLEKNSGLIKIFDQELNEENLADIRDKVGIVFQNPDNQFIGSTVRDDIAFGLENHMVKREEMDSIIEKFSKRVSMDQFLESEPSKLSGGQKQRVAIAGVLAMAPDILIFDEATSMLDPDGKREINNLINEIHKEKELTIITITHDLNEALNCQEIIVIDKGEIVMKGKPEDVFSNEELLTNHKLDLPFPLKVKNALKKQGLKIDKVLKMEDLVEEICQLNLKK